MNSFWNQVLWGNTLQDWAIATGIVIGCIILLRLFKRILLTRIQKWSSRTNTTIDDFFAEVLGRLIIPFLYLFAIYAALNYLHLQPKAARIIDVVILVIGTFFVIRLITSAIAYSVRTYSRTHEEQGSRIKQIRGILLVVNIIIWMLGIVFLLDNFGYDITTIVAGLGIGGIAIALASQAILGDLFSYFVIFFDKPFEIGDFIIVDDKMGSVEYIGIKTTRLRTLSGEQLVFANTDLTNSRVHNYKRMEQRRIEFIFRVVHQTPAGKLRALPGLIKEIIDSQPNTKFDRTHFKTIGQSSLDFEVIYFILSPDYNVFMDTQQSINLAIYELFEQQEIRFAYPTQMIVLDEQSRVTLDPGPTAGDRQTGA